MIRIYSYIAIVVNVHSAMCNANVHMLMVIHTDTVPEYITAYTQALTARAAASVLAKANINSTNSSSNNNAAPLSPRRAASVRVPLKSILTASAFQALASNSNSTL
jgi:predicted RNA-binding Zn ribbon-like protein